MALNNFRFPYTAKSAMARYMYFVLFFITVTDLTTAYVTHRVRPGCELITNEDWSKTQALILNENMTKIIHPEYEDSVLLSPTEHIVLACPGSELSLKEEPDTTALCSRGTQLNIDRENYEFSSMSCKKLPVTSTRVVGRCLDDTVNGSKIEIGFDVDVNFIKLLDVCFNDKSLSAVYSHYVATPKIIGRQRGFPRRQFQDAGFYHGLKVQWLYSRAQQRNTISEILGSKELGEKYIQNDSSYYLSRGHLSAKSDFIYGSEQMGTFYYINVAPQWQIINAGNWATLESNVRDYVAGSSEISVYTLPYEVALLPDVHNNLKKLYLYRSSSNIVDDDDDNDIIEEQKEEGEEEEEEGVVEEEEGVVVEEEEEDTAYEYIDLKKKKFKYLIPVPKFYIKILYHEETKKGTAFVTINNPYLKNITSDYILCNDICDKYHWLTWNQTNIDLGYSYCCPYKDLKSIVNTLPDLDIEDIL